MIIEVAAEELTLSEYLLQKVYFTFLLS